MAEQEEEHRMVLVETLRIGKRLQLTYVCVSNCGQAMRRNFLDKDFDTATAPEPAPARPDTG